MTKRIGIDVDGVLADFNQSFVKYVEAVTGVQLFPVWPFDIPIWDYPTYYGYTQEQASQVWETIKRDEKFWLSLPPYVWTPKFMHTINSTQSPLDDVYFITSRPGNAAKTQTENWLRLHGYWFAPTVLISSRKDLCAEALDLTHYVDDRYENVVSVAKLRGDRTKVFLLNQPWNQTTDMSGIPRISSLDQMFK